MVELIPIEPKHIGQAWAMGAHNLSKACETSGGDITGDQLKMMLMRGERQLLSMVRDGAPVGWCAYSVVSLPNKRVCFVYALYAPGGGFAEFLPILWAWASADGCEEIQCEAGEAQATLYKRAGFEPVRTVMRYKQ